MKSLQFTSPQSIESNPLRLHEVPVPTISRREILIRVRTCGICHTDLHVVEGELQQKKAPLTPGHQIVGIVEQVGKNVTALKVGDRSGHHRKLAEQLRSGVDGEGRPGAAGTS